MLQECQGGMLLDRHQDQDQNSTNLLGLGGRQEFSQEVEIQSSRHETRNFSTQLLYQMVDRIGTRLDFQDGVLTHTLRRWQVC